MVLVRLQSVYRTVRLLSPKVHEEYWSVQLLPLLKAPEECLEPGEVRRRHRQSEQVM